MDFCIHMFIFIYSVPDERLVLRMLYGDCSMLLNVRNRRIMIWFCDFFFCLCEKMQRLRFNFKGSIIVCPFYSY